jgi:hypothetical protein
MILVLLLRRPQPDSFALMFRESRNISGHNLPDRQIEIIPKAQLFTLDLKAYLFPCDRRPKSPPGCGPLSSFCNSPIARRVIRLHRCSAAWLTMRHSECAIQIACRAYRADPPVSGFGSMPCSSRRAAQSLATNAAMLVSMPGNTASRPH